MKWNQANWLKPYEDGLFTGQTIHCASNASLCNQNEGKWLCQLTLFLDWNWCFNYHRWTRNLQRAHERKKRQRHEADKSTVQFQYWSLANVALFFVCACGRLPGKINFNFYIFLTKWFAGSSVLIRFGGIYSVMMEEGKRTRLHINIINRQTHCDHITINKRNY